MDDIAQTKLIIAIAVIGGLLAAERVLPMAKRPTGHGRVFVNFALAAINGILSPAFIVPLTAAAAAIAFDWRPAAWAGPLELIVDLLLLDLWIYLWHRAAHVTPFLWRFHEVHHLDRFLDVSSAVRFHFGEVVLSALARGAFVLASDVSLTAVLIFDALVLISAVFHHSNLAIPPAIERALRLVIVTPSHHWVHHHRVRRDTDSNYGTVLTIWDRLFRSWSPTVRTPDMPIGTEGREEKPLPRLLADPLWRRE